MLRSDKHVARLKRYEVLPLHVEEATDLDWLTVGSAACDRVADPSLADQRHDPADSEAAEVSFGRERYRFLTERGFSCNPNLSRDRCKELQSGQPSDKRPRSHGIRGEWLCARAPRDRDDDGENGGDRPESHERRMAHRDPTIPEGNRTDQLFPSTATPTTSCLIRRTGRSIERSTGQAGRRSGEPARRRRAAGP